MSDKRFRPKICGCCARVDEFDIGRRYCPTTASRIYENKPAEKCRFFIDDDGFRRERKNRRNEDVFEE